MTAGCWWATRTIYNHFRDKSQLFQAVIQDSATRAADAQIAIIDHHLHKVTDLEADLVDLGRALATPMTDEHREHFALVQQVNAEAGHIPQAAIDAWQDAGPRRVRRELARRLEQLADRGLLHLDDPERAALHLMLLMTTTDPAYRRSVHSEQQIDETVTAGVRAFLHGYAPPGTQR